MSINNKQDLRSQGIYKDKHNRYIYYNKKDQTGIVIPEADLKKWNIYRSRYFLPLIVFIFLFTVFQQYLYLELIGVILLYIVLELNYRKLKAGYTVIPDYQPQEKFSRQKEIEKDPIWRTATRCVLWLVFGGLLPYYWVSERLNYSALLAGNIDELLLAVFIIAAVGFSIYNFFTNLRVLLKKRAS